MKAALVCGRAEREAARRKRRKEKTMWKISGSPSIWTINLLSAGDRPARILVTHAPHRSPERDDVHQGRVSFCAEVAR